MTIRGENPGFERDVSRALAQLVRYAPAPETAWAGVESAISSGYHGRPRILGALERLIGLLTLRRRMSTAAGIASLALIILATASVGTWAWLADNRSPSIDQASSSANALQVWQLEDGSWLTGGEELTRFVAHVDDSWSVANASPFAPGSDGAHFAESLSNLATQSFSVTSEATPYAQVPQAAHLGTTHWIPEYKVPPDLIQPNPESLDPLRDDGMRQWMDPSRLIWASPTQRITVEECEEWGSVPTIRIEFDSVTSAGDSPEVMTITSFRCLVQDAASGHVVGESYYGPATASSAATVNTDGDFRLRKESRPAGPIPLRGTTYWGTVTEWRTEKGRLESRTELINGEYAQEQLSAEWTDTGLRFESDRSTVDWLLATQFYAPVNRPDGSLLAAPFDSVESVEDEDPNDTLATFKAVREQGPSGREEWEVVVNLEHMRPVRMTIAAGTGAWQQSARFEFSYGD